VDEKLGAKPQKIDDIVGMQRLWRDWVLWHVCTAGAMTWWMR